ncbi:colicin E3/pyocin S6 family cytotoxin [Corynebacterium sp. CQ3829_602738]
MASYIPRPRPGFLDNLERLSRSGPPRWRDLKEKRLFEYDPLHGHIEGYNLRGEHVGVYDAVSGMQIGDPIRGRKIDV